MKVGLTGSQTNWVELITAIGAFICLHKKIMLAYANTLTFIWGLARPNVVLIWKSKSACHGGLKTTVNKIDSEVLSL